MDQTVKFTLIADGAGVVRVVRQVGDEFQGMGSAASSASSTAASAIDRLETSQRQATAATLAEAAAQREAAQAQRQTEAAQASFMASLREQIALYGKGESDVLRYRAAQAGVAEQAASLILQLDNMRAAQRQAAQAAAEEAAAQRQAAEARRQAQASADAFVAGLREQVATLGMSRTELLAHRAAQLGVTEQAGPMIARLAEGDATMKRYGVSAGQMSQAMRMLPMQLTDVATSLASGMPIWMVAIQQGGQVKDSFGGLRPMFDGLRSVLTPTNLALGGLAAAAALAIAAIVEGRAETSAYNQALTLTGNQAGKTAGQLAEMAASLAQGRVTQGAAAAALAEIAATGKISGDVMRDVGAAATQMSVATGRAVKDIVAEFVKLGEEPSKASAKLNEQYHYLTSAVYQQIVALEKAGKTDEAAELAQRTYAQAMRERAETVQQNLGTLEKAWNSLGNVAKAAWDKLLNLGREDTLGQQLDAAYETVRKAQERVDALRRSGGLAGNGTAQSDLERAQQEVQYLREKGKLLNQQAESQAKATDANQKAIAAQDAIRTATERYSSETKKLNRELAEHKRQFDAIRAADPSSELLKGEQALYAAIRKTYAERGNMASAAKDASAARIEALQREQRLQDEIAKRTTYQIKLQGDLQKLTPREVIEQTAQVELDALEQQRTGLEAQLAIYRKRKDSLKDQQQVIGELALLEERVATRRAQLAGDQARLDKQRADQIRDVTQAQREQEADEARAYRDAYAARYFAAAEAVRAYAKGLRESAEAARLEAGALGQSSVARDTAVRNYRIQLELEKQIEAIEAQRLTKADQLAKIEEATSAAAVARAQLTLQASRKALNDYFDPARAKEFGDVVADAFGAVGNSIKGILNALDTYAQKQAEIVKLTEHAKVLQQAAGDAWASGEILRAIQLEGEARQANDKIAERGARNQIGLYASIAGAAKGFFQEGSKGYQILSAAEKAFQAYQLASDIVKGTSAAAVAVANQAQGDPYTAWARMAAMAAAMAALGFAISGGFNTGGGGPTAATRQATQGTGTVFGDASAKSESITRSLEALTDSAKIELTYQSGMLAALRSIDAAMNGLANMVVRTTGLTSGNTFGVELGTLSKNTGDPLVKALTGINDSFLTKLMGPLGGIIATLQSLWGKTTQEITDSGLMIRGLVSELAAGSGVSQYADVRTTSTSWFGLKSSTSTNTLTQSVDAQIAQQFGLIFKGVGDALKAASASLGRDADVVGAAIAAYFVEIPRASLRGLSGTDLQNAINNLISSATDEIAKAIVPGLDDFRQIGEGYFETVVRVASGVETAQYALEKFGISAVNFTNLIQKQGDVAAEIVRQSIVQAESYTLDTKTGLGGRMNITGTADRSGVVDVVSGVGQIIQTMSGSADDIASVYEALLAVRGAMRSVGETGMDLSAAMLRGAGGIERLQAGLDDYLEKYFSSSEKTAAATARLAEQFALIGVAMPTSNAGFRELVSGIDTSTEAGQQLYGQVVALAGAFAQLHPMVERTASAIDLTNAVRAQDIRIMELLGDATGALAARRQDELAAMDPSLRAKQEYIYSLQDEAAATQQRTGLEQQLMQLTGDTAGLRERELQALDPSNRALQERIYALQDAATAEQAAQEAAQAAQQAMEQMVSDAGINAATLADTIRDGLLGRISEAQLGASLADQVINGVYNALAGGFAQQITNLLVTQIVQPMVMAAATGGSVSSAVSQAAIDTVVAKATQAAQALGAILADPGFQAAIQAVGNAITGALASAVTNIPAPSYLPPVYTPPVASTTTSAPAFTSTSTAERTSAANDALQERARLERELLQLTGDTVEIRRQELAELDPTNRDLQERVWALQDEQAALQAAIASSGISAATLADTIRDGLLGRIVEADLGSRMANQVINGVYNALAGGFAQQITGVLMQQVINPMVTAAAAGGSLASAVSQAAIDAVVAKASQAAAALGAILADPGFQQMIQQVGNMLTGAFASTVTSVPAPVYQAPVYTPPSAPSTGSGSSGGSTSDAAAARAAEVARERIALQDQLDELTMTSTQLLAKQRDALDESNRALFDQIQAEKQRRAVLEERAGLQEQLDQLTLSSAELLARQRDALDESNRALFDQVQAAQAAAAAQEAAQARAEAVAQERAGLQQQLDQLTLSSTELLARQRDALDESNRALFDQVQAAQAAAAAQQAAQARAEAVAQERAGLQQQLDQLTLSSTELLARQRAALDESNRALFDQVQAAQAAAAAQQAAQARAEAVAQERANLQQQLDQLTLSSTELLARQRDALDESNRALFDQVQAAQAAAAALTAAAERARAVATERTNLETRLLQLQGDTAALRQRELEQLDPSNRELLERIYALEDSQAAEAAARQAAEAAAQAAQRLRDAWQSVGDSIAKEVARIRGLSATDQGSLAELEARFAVATAQARAGDQKAADALPALSQALLALAEEQSASTVELRRWQTSIAASLDETLTALAAYGFDRAASTVLVPGFADGGDHAGGWRIVGERGAELEATGAARIFDAATTRDILGGGARGGGSIAALVEGLQRALGGQHDELLRALVQIVVNTGRTERHLADVKSDTGDGVVVAQRTGDRLPVSTS